MPRLFRRLKAALAFVALSVFPREPLAAQQLVHGDAPPTMVIRKVATPPQLDGRLDDAMWQLVPASTSFRQVEPSTGAPARLETTVRMAQDERALYVAVRASEPAGRDGIRVRDLRRDFQWGRSDAVGFVIDGIGDGRSIQAFATSAYGAQWDAQVTDGGLLDLEWDAPWVVRTHVDSTEWSAEFAIPWSTLRLAAGATTWRINVTREVPRLGETAAWAPWPRGFGIFRMEFAGTVQLDEAPPVQLPLRVTPYLLASDRTGATARARTAMGGEMQWRPSPTAGIDASINTDFAEVDVDRQVVNLTRFNVLLPERRPFFLEQRGLFTVGAPDRLLPFFTRRVGLSPAGSPIPIEVGIRGTVRDSAWSGAVLGVREGRTDASGAASLAVIRAQRTFGSRLRIGALAVGRARDAFATEPRARDATLALDVMARPRRSLTLQALHTRSMGTGGDGAAWWAQSQFVSPTLSSTLAVERIARGYVPVAGFVARGDLRRVSGRTELDWRPSWRPAGVRGFRPSVSHAVAWRDHDGAFQEAELTVRTLSVEFLNTARVAIDAGADWQRLDSSLDLLPGLRLLPGSYVGGRVSAEFQSNVARPLVATVNATTAEFFDGRLRRATSRLAWSPRPQAALDVSHTVASFDGVGSVRGHLTTHLLAPELRLAPSPRLQVTTFYQHNTAARQGALYARMSWEYRRFSYLTVAYNQRRPLPTPGEIRRAQEPTQSQLVAKLTWTHAP